MLCQFLLYHKVNQLYVYIYPLLLKSPSHCPHPAPLENLEFLPMPCDSQGEAPYSTTNYQKPMKYKREGCGKTLSLKISDQNQTAEGLEFQSLQGILRSIFPGGTVVKNLPTSAGDAKDMSLIPRSGRSPRIGNGNPLQYSFLENPQTEERGGLQSMGSQRVRHD